MVTGLLRLRPQCLQSHSRHEKICSGNLSVERSPSNCQVVWLWHFSPLSSPVGRARWTLALNWYGETTKKCYSGIFGYEFTFFCGRILSTRSSRRVQELRSQFFWPRSNFSMDLMLCPGFISFSRRWFDGGVDGLVPIVAMIILQMHRMWHPKSKHHRVICWHK